MPQLSRPLRPRHGEQGFTLVELIVTFAVLGFMLALAAPSFAVWINNNKVRSAADALQTRLRQAQAEAVRRNRVVSYARYDIDPMQAGAAISATGTWWGLRTVPPLVGGEPADVIASGALNSDSGKQVTISGPRSICFGPTGRQVANVGEGCTAPVAVTYDLSIGGAQQRPLRVTTSLSGQIRMCDPARPTTGTDPDRCPA